MSEHDRGPVPGKALFAGLAILALGIALAVFLATGMLGSAGGGDSDAAQAEASAARGHALAEANCAGCHAVAESDESPDPAAPPFRTFKDKWPLENLEEALAEGIVTGHDNDMPEFEFAPPAIADFIAYLRTL